MTWQPIETAKVDAPFREWETDLQMWAREDPDGFRRYQQCRRWVDDLAMAVGAGLIAALLLVAGPALAIEPGCYEGLPLHVTDGDTVWFLEEVEGEAEPVRVSVRLLGYDTPEVRGHQECPEELALGTRATALLQQLLDNHSAILCVLPATCGYDRPCGMLTVRQGGYTLDVGAILISEGLAVPFTGEMGEWCD